MPESNASKTVSPWLLGGFLAYFAAILPLFAWGLWRLIADNTDPGPGAGETQLVLDQGQLILAVMLAGGIGSYIHGVNSFVTYVGNRSFVNSWAAWYVLRPFMGIGMAVIFYVVVRGGVLVMSGGESKVDPYAMMTVAALAGMFSKQASDKLAEVFDTLFRSRADQERGDKLEKPVPSLTALTPSEVKAGSGETVVTATGTGFATDSVVKFDDADRAATFKSATELTFTLTASDVAAAGEHTVAIFNPAGGGTTSNQQKFTVTAVVAVPKIVGGDAGAGAGAGSAGQAPHGDAGGDGGGAAG